MLNGGEYNNPTTSVIVNMIMLNSICLSCIALIISTLGGVWLVSAMWVCVGSASWVCW